MLATAVATRPALAPTATGSGGGGGGGGLLSFISAPLPLSEEVSSTNQIGHDSNPDTCMDTCTLTENSRPISFSAWVCLLESGRVGGVNWTT